MRDAATTILLVAGTAVAGLACLGALLMRDALDRLHYTGALTAAALLIGAAVFVRESFSLIGDRAIIVAVLVLVTNPVLTHATARTLHKRRAAK
jgi:multicomponent Na+:H+ antiporter subunit G